MKRTARNAVRTAVAIGAALTLFTGLSTSAQAAGGEFRYVNVNEDDFTLENPTSGECYLLLSGAKRAENATNARASLFTERGCEGGAALVMRPGTSANFGASVPHSVRFG
ncbi:hypothetical protein ACFXDJ_25285 [Streptomyces sp. NPDC059443]|uniref:hypothetical protein n=1 Tax=unclassified Streptomyces TaxID=2593676 RepID=UPI003680EA5E